MLAFTFPGQGSQRPGMGRTWLEHPSWEVVGEASAVAGRDIGHLLVEADQDELTLTANAQLTTFVLGLVVLDAIERLGIEPTLCAGHSLGEYSALVAAGAKPRAPMDGAWIDEIAVKDVSLHGMELASALAYAEKERWLADSRTRKDWIYLTRIGEIIAKQSGI